MADLQAIYGVANVKDERICGPECADSIDVTRIYPEKIMSSLFIGKTVFIIPLSLLSKLIQLVVLIILPADSK